MLRRMFYYVLIMCWIVAAAQAEEPEVIIRRHDPRQTVKSDAPEAPETVTKKAPPEKSYTIEEMKTEAYKKEHGVIKNKANVLRYDKPDMFAKAMDELRGPQPYPTGYKMAEFNTAKTEASRANREKLNWIERGPGNVSGRTRAIAVDPDDATANTWFVGSVSGGIWKTTNAGSSWQFISPNLPNISISCIAIAPSNRNIIYAGTGESFGGSTATAGDGLIKSTDRGLTWAILPSTSDFPAINRLIVDPNNANIVLIATQNTLWERSVTAFSRIYKTTDGGATWRMVHEEALNVTVNAIQQIVADPTNFNIQYASVNSKGVMKSTDAGETWQLLPWTLPAEAERIEIAVAPSNPQVLYASVEGAPDPQRPLYKTTDGGATWNELTNLTIVNRFATNRGSRLLEEQGWYDNTIAVNPFDAEEVYAGGIDVWRLSGTSFERISNWTDNSLPHADQHNLTIVPLDATAKTVRVLNGNDGGVYYTNNKGAVWRKTQNGYNSTQFYGVAKRHTSDQYIGGMQDNGTWQSRVNPTAASSWLERLGGDGFEVAWNYLDPNKILGGQYYNSLDRSLDGGFSWTSLSGFEQGEDAQGSLGPFITKIANCNLDPDFICIVGRSGVWSSRDFGTTWRVSRVPAEQWSMSSLSQVEISLANPQIVWAGSRMNHPDLPEARLFLSRDGAATFQAVNSYNERTLGTTSGLSTHPIDEGTAYACFAAVDRPKIVRTTDFGQTWQDITGFGPTGTSSNNGFPDVMTFCVLVMPHNPNILWAGTEIGLFESTDNGVSWHYADNGIPASPIWQMHVVDDEIVVATHGRGIWTVTMPELPYPRTAYPQVKSFKLSSGTIDITVALRAVYDSTQIVVNGQIFRTIAANTAMRDTVIKYPVSGAATLNIKGVAYSFGHAYQGDAKTFATEPKEKYSNNFNSSSDADFTGAGFAIIPYPGFSSSAIHSLHPYPNGSSIFYQLNTPITIKAGDALMSFDEIVLAEPGIGTFPNADFGDYVIVEGSKDGQNWLRVVDGYNSGANATWLDYFNSKEPTEAIFVRRTIDLSKTFAANDKVYFRFRLVTNAEANGWGWVIDNLEIQEKVAVEDEPAAGSKAFVLSQNYPNPFNPSTIIAFALPQTSPVSLKVYDLAGRLVKTLVDEKMQPGDYEIVWNARNIPSGSYIYQLKADGFDQTRKMTLLK